MNIIDALLETGTFDTRGACRRAIKQGAVSIDDVRAIDVATDVATGQIIRFGKSHAWKVTSPFCEMWDAIARFERDSLPVMPSGCGIVDAVRT